MEQSDLLRFVAAALERLGLRYFVTGSTVTIFYGEPRFTNDIDIVSSLKLTSTSVKKRPWTPSGADLNSTLSIHDPASRSM